MILLLLFYNLFYHSAISQATYLCDDPQGAGALTCMPYPCIGQMDVNDIVNLPIIKIQVDFHLVESNGFNFQCNDENEDFFAPTYMDKILDRANEILSDPDFSNQSTSQDLPDSRLRLVYYGEPNDPCDAIFFHSSTPTQFQNEDAIHIILRDEGEECAGHGSGGNPITLYDFHCSAQNDPDLSAVGYGTLLLHEFGHNFLNHSFATSNDCPDMTPGNECGDPSGAITCSDGSNCPQNQPSDPGGSCFRCFCTWNNSNNFMSYGIQTGMTVSQWAAIYGQLAIDNPDYGYAFVEPGYCQPFQTGPIEIPSNTVEIWEGIRYIDRNVEIRPGAALIVRCHLWMADGATIVVNRGARLFVEGAEISTLSEECSWGGIMVHGNDAIEQPDPEIAKDLNQFIPMNGAGVVWLFSSTLKGANTAVTTRAGGSLNTHAYFGGLVMAEYTKFLGNKRSVEFMKYDLRNKSYFDNCIFRHEEGTPFTAEYGITIWGCRDISISDNTVFKDLTTAGVYGIDYSANISGCLFENIGEYGIHSLSSRPNSVLSTTVIYDNDFKETSFDIYLLAAPNVINGFNIDYNRFYEGNTHFDRGIYINGESSYTIQDNYFDNKFISAQILSSGEFFNVFKCNYLYEIDYNGIWVSYTNSGLKILGNTFYDKDYRLIDLSGSESTPGSIHPLQGNLSVSAGNCFEDGINNEIRSLSTSTVSFDYFVRDLANPVPCELPHGNLSDGGTNNYYTWGADKPYDCDSQQQIENFTTSDLQSARSATSTALSSHLADPQNLQKKVAYYNAAAYQDTVLKMLAQNAFEEDSIKKAEDLLLGESLTAYKRSVVSLKLHRGDLTGADSLLNTLPIVSQDDQWFYDIMQIHLNAEPDPYSYQLSSQEEQLLLTIADSAASIMRGYACALLALYTPYACEVPAFGQEQGLVQQTSSQAYLQQGEYTIYPNPTSSELNIKIPGNEVESIDIEITDLNGSTIYKSQLYNSKSYSIRLPELAPGIYFMKISHNAFNFDIKKIIIH